MADSIYKSDGTKLHLKDFDVYSAKLTEGIIAANHASARKRPYWILHLDCGRKYFSVTNIKAMIDEMAENGLNQLQLHFSENRGFRFALDDMNFITDNGTEYDLSSVPTTTTGGYLTQSQMDEIIVYAHGKNIDIVPSLDMPGHMTILLNSFTNFAYKGNTWTLDCTNETAVEFALAIVNKYSKYFASRGCKYWNIGADEVCQPNSGRWYNLDTKDVPDFIQFINLVAETVSRNGMIPRAFNDGILYGRDYSNYINRNIEVYYWASASTLSDTKMLSAEELRENGFKLINTNLSWYFIIPRDNGKTSNGAVENANLLKSFTGGSLSTDQDGACICVWCDNDTTADGGDAALSAILADITSFGTGISLTTANISYPIIT